MRVAQAAVAALLLVVGIGVPAASQIGSRSETFSLPLQQLPMLKDQGLSGDAQNLVRDLNQAKKAGAKDYLISGNELAILGSSGQREWGLGTIEPIPISLGIGVLRNRGPTERPGDVEGHNQNLELKLQRALLLCPLNGSRRANCIANANQIAKAGRIEETPQCAAAAAALQSVDQQCRSRAWTETRCNREFTEKGPGFAAWCLRGPEASKLPSTLAASTAALRAAAFIQIQQGQQGTLTHLCSGVFVGNRELLTARHCFNTLATATALRAGGQLMVGSLDPAVDEMWRLEAVPDWQMSLTLPEIANDQIRLKISGQPSSLQTLEKVTVTKSSQLFVPASFAYASGQLQDPQGMRESVSRQAQNAVRWAPEGSCRSVEVGPSGLKCFRFVCRTVSGFSGGPVFARADSSKPWGLAGIVHGGESVDSANPSYCGAKQFETPITVAAIPNLAEGQ
jgi:Trypsin